MPSSWSSRSTVAPKITLPVLLSAGGVDDFGGRQLGLDLADAAFDESLLLARGVVFGVLGEVAVAARLGDRLDDARPILALQPLQFVAQRFSAAQGHRSAFHDLRLFVQVLEPVHFHGIQVIQSFAGCERACERRVVGDALVHCFPAYGIGLADGGLAFGGVHDHGEFVVLDHVDDVRPPLAHLVGTLAGHARIGDRRAVPSVAAISKPFSTSFLASPTAPGLSRSRTLMSTTPTAWQGDARTPPGPSRRPRQRYGPCP